MLPLLPIRLPTARMKSPKPGIMSSVASTSNPNPALFPIPPPVSSVAPFASWTTSDYCFCCVPKLQKLHLCTCQSSCLWPSSVWYQLFRVGCSRNWFTWKCLWWQIVWQIALILQSFWIFHCPCLVCKPGNHLLFFLFVSDSKVHTTKSEIHLSRIRIVLRFLGRISLCPDTQVIKEPWTNPLGLQLFHFSVL